VVGQAGLDEVHVVAVARVALRDVARLLFLGLSARLGHLSVTRVSEPVRALVRETSPANQRHHLQNNYEQWRGVRSSLDLAMTTRISNIT
jgi:hypothetical protein